MALIDYLQDRLNQIGFDTERIEYEDENGIRKANVIGKKGEGIGGMSYFGHTDVIPADVWFTEQYGPFAPTVTDGKLYGRGACDMKGSIACMLSAAERFDHAELAKPLYVACSADEEIGYGGALQIQEKSKHYREMVAGQSNTIIGEPTLLEVVYAHKGGCMFTATARGQSAHTSTDAGVNANWTMIPFLVEIKKLYEETQQNPEWQDPEFDPPTLALNIGIGDHPEALNVTKPISICRVGFRPMPRTNTELLLEKVKRAAQKCGVELEITDELPAFYVDGQSDFIKEVLRISNKTKAHTVSYGSEAVIFNELERRVVIGPGNIEQAHTIDEWISLEQLERGTDVYAQFIRAWSTS